MNAGAIFTLENSALSASVRAFGAELCSVTSIPTQVEYIWQGDPAVWPRHAPVLFPIVGKLNNNSYTHHGQAYHMSQHGFARDRSFNLIAHTKDTLTFELKSDEQSLPAFPFPFSLQVSYALSGQSIDTTYTVHNPSEAGLYFSIGAHPGFNCPLQKGEAFHAYRLEFPGTSQLTCQHISGGLLTGKTYPVPLTNHGLDVSAALFANDALVLAGSQVDEVRLVSKSSGYGVSVSCKGWPYFGIWSKKDTEQFVCLEPWFGIAGHAGATGELADKKGIIRLPAGDTFSCQYKMSFF